MPIAEQSIATNGVTNVTPWTEARFAEANRYWLATVRPDGRPHIMPVFGVWVGDALYFTAARTSRKAKNLALNARCVVAADVPTLDVVVEGEARQGKRRGEAPSRGRRIRVQVRVAPDGARRRLLRGVRSALRRLAPVRPVRNDAGDGLRSRHGRAIRGHPLEILERAGEAAHGEHTCSDRSNSHTSPHRSDASGWMDVGWRSDEAKETR